MLDNFTIGTQASPVTIMVMGNDERGQKRNNGQSTLFYRALQGLSSATISPMAFKLPPDFEKLGNVVSDLVGDNETATNQPITSLPPGTLPTNWKGVVRDLREADEMDPVKIVHLGIPDADTFNRYILNEEVFIRMMLSLVWGTMKTNRYLPRPGNGKTVLECPSPLDTLHPPPRETMYSYANVSLVGMFAIMVQRAIGHRDFIRILVDDNNNFHVRTEDSFIVQSTVEPEDHQPSADITWKPRPGTGTKFVVTYTVFPYAGDTVPTPALQPPVQLSQGFDNEQASATMGATDDFPNGLYLTVTNDVHIGYTLHHGTKRVYHETVLPESTPPATRQFFVPTWTAVTLPANLPVRFSSHPTKRLCVVGIIHELIPPGADHLWSDEKLLDTELAFARKLDEESPFPFDRAHFEEINTQSIFIGRNDQRQQQSSDNASHSNTSPYMTSKTPFVVGAIPVFKSLSNISSRKYILSIRSPGQALEAKNSGSSTPPFLVSPPWNTTTLNSFQTYKLFTTSHNDMLICNNFPITQMAKMLREFDSTSFFFNPSILANLPISFYAPSDYHVSESQ